VIKILINQIKCFLITIFLLSINSCATVHNQSLVPGATTAVAPYLWPTVMNGSLFQENTPINYGYQPLFEDHRPHNVGDIITVVLQESISASNSSSSNISRDGIANLGVTLFPGQLNPMTEIGYNENKTGLDSIGKNNFSGKGSNSAHNKFTGLITVTVKKVLPNGNLQVIGEKQVAINEGIEFIRFSGIVNPSNINQNNLVASTQIADTRIEYLSNGRVNQMQKMGWLQRVLLSMSPM